MFFFDCTATTEISTYGRSFSLHDARPIESARAFGALRWPGRLRVPASELDEDESVNEPIEKESKSCLFCTKLCINAVAHHRYGSLGSKIGRASCRERGCQFVSLSVFALSLQNKMKASADGAKKIKKRE